MRKTNKRVPSREWSPPRVDTSTKRRDEQQPRRNAEGASSEPGQGISPLKEAQASNPYPVGHPAHACYTNLAENLLCDRVKHCHVQRLVKGGHTTLALISKLSRYQLVNALQLEGETADEILKRARIHPPGGFISASVVHDALSKRVKITSGSSCIDELIGGGFETHTLVELNGISGAGKTQMCHMIAITAQMTSEMSIDRPHQRRVLYVDTENTFRSDRLHEIGKRYGLSPTDITDGIQYARAHSTDHLKELLVNATALISSGGYSALIIDSIIALVRSEFNLGLGALAARQSTLMGILTTCKKISEEFGILVVVTNQMVANVDAGESHSGNTPPKEIPTGGHVMSHFVTSRFKLHRKSSGKRIFSVSKSPSVPTGETLFRISSNGICDVEHENTEEMDTDL